MSATLRPARLALASKPCTPLPDLFRSSACTSPECVRCMQMHLDSKSPPLALTPDNLMPGRLEHSGRGSIQQYGLGWVWSRRRQVLFPWAVTNRAFCEGLLEGYHNIGERHGRTEERTCHAPLSAVNWTRKEAQSCGRFILAIPAADHACSTGGSSTRHCLERPWLYGIVTLPLVIVSVQGCLGYALS